jgi:undecaprenyl-diphosphatase
MTYIDSVILGLVQGVTEFLPISSSGHLVIASHLLGVKDAFTFDSLLNIGTLIALISYYRKRIWEILKRIFAANEWLFIIKLIAATIPAALVGVIFDQQITKMNDMVWVVIVMLLLVGVPMILVGNPDKNADNRVLEKSLSWLTTIKVGIAQAISLIPGTSRSGITILVGLRSKLSAAKAAEFSFLMAIPIIAAASLKILLSSDGLNFVKSSTGQFLVGNLVSLVSGMIAISFFIKLLSSRGLKDFGWYRVSLAAVLIILVATGVI